MDLTCRASLGISGDCLGMADIVPTSTLEQFSRLCRLLTALGSLRAGWEGVPSGRKLGFMGRGRGRHYLSASTRLP